MIDALNLMSATKFFSLSTSARTIAQRASSILRKFGTNAHIYLPGFGTINGLQAGNFSDSAGTVIATTDQPLGLVLDTASGYGPELVVNGDFSNTVNSTYGWLPLSAPTVNVNNGIVQVTAAVADYSSITQTVPAITGKSYMVSWKASRPVGPAWVVLNSQQVINNLIVANTHTAGRRFIVAGRDSLSITLQTQNVIGTTAFFSNISIREVPGIHATQNTTNSKPTLRQGTINLIPNSMMVGASGTTPPTGWVMTPTASSGITATTVGSGIEDGRNYVDILFNGTATGQSYVAMFPSFPGLIPAVVGEVFTASMYVRRVGGTSPYSFSFQLLPRNAASTPLSTPATVNLELNNATLTRHVITGANPADTAGIQSRITIATITSGTVVNDIIRVASPQIERGSVVTDFVPTSTGAASSGIGPSYWEFNGSTHHLPLAAPLFQLSDDHCVIAGAKPDTTTTDCDIFGQRNLTAVNPLCPLLRLGADGRFKALYRDDAGTLSGAQATVPYTQNVAAVFSARKRSSEIIAQINGGSRHTISSNFSTAQVNTAAIGAGITSGVLGPFRGNIYPVIAIKGTVSDADLLTLEKFVGLLSGVVI